jgi:hypothetical protein
LVNPAKISIKRHIKIVAEANPYDKELDVYFENRLKHKMCNSFSNNQNLRIIWNMQKGKCPVCLQNITLETKWDIHHKLPKSKGGDNKNSNLEMLHINCHRQIHNRGFQLWSWFLLKEVSRGLSRMMGNYHVRFLGDGRIVISLLLPDSYFFKRFSKFSYIS